MDKISYSIGKWIRKLRMDQGLTSPVLAKEIGINQASLSRIETGRSDITVFTLKRVLNALDLPFSELQKQGVVNYPYRDPDTYFVPFRLTSPPLPGLTLDDVREYAKLSPEKRQTALVTLYKKFADLSYPDAIAKRIQGPETLPSPIEYIYEIKIETLEQAAAANTVLILSDVGSFIYQRRKSLPFSLYNAYQDKSEDLPFSYASITRLEQNFNKRVIVDEMIKLDQVLQAQGELFALCWHAMGDYLELLKLQPSDKTEKDWLAETDTLVSICRLYQIALPGMIHWPDDFRNTIKTQTE